MQIKQNKVQDYLVVEIGGRLDSVTAAEFEQASVKWLADGENNIVLDLKQLDYISSAGLRVILALAKKLKQSQGSLSWCSLSEIVLDVVQCAGFDSFIPVYPNSGAAMK